MSGKTGAGLSAWRILTPDGCQHEPARTVRVHGHRQVSRTGTVIGSHQLGQGPAAILLHGAGQTAENLRSLAGGLAGAFTVYVPDRRGRGRSGPYGQFHGLRTEIEDLSALLDATGARCVFGLSAGAVIAIETARTRPQIAKARVV